MTCRASIALASYNGALYIRDQIESILDMMHSDDQLVVSDDGSTDGTYEIIDEYTQKDKRIILVTNNGQHGVQNNFNNALKYCIGEYIFYADQDDVWVNDKINKVINVFHDRKADLVIHNGYQVDEHLNIIDKNKSLFLEGGISKNPFRNFIKGTYWGCCMSFSRHLLPLILPLPSYSVGHDLWTGVVAGFWGKRIELIDEIMIYHRLHINNVTPKIPNPIKERLKNRAIFFMELYKRYIRTTQR